eukprot:1182551-Prorocentrum_minimum.AAC.2
MNHLARCADKLPARAVATTLSYHNVNTRFSAVLARCLASKHVFAGSCEPTPRVNSLITRALRRHVPHSQTHFLDGGRSNQERRFNDSRGHIGPCGEGGVPAPRARW